MWDNHRLLNRVANALYLAAAAAIAYGLAMAAIGSPLFALREVQVRGDTVHTSVAQVQALAARELNGTFFTLGLQQASATFEKLPWVRVAQVRRVWPDRLEVVLEEHVPLARWGAKGLVNLQGEVFHAATDARLPVLAGPEGTAGEMARHYAAFEDMLAAVGREPVEVRLSVRRAWQITLDDGQILELGRQDLLPRLARYVAAYRTIVAHVPPGARIDLRYENGFAIRQPGLHWGQQPA